MFTIVQFSPTGNTAYLATQLSKFLATDQIYALEHTHPTTLQGGKHLILMFPIHGFNVPKIVVQFARDLPHGKFEDVSVVGVGCNELWVNQGATLALKKILKEKGYALVLDEIIAMPLTFVMQLSEETMQAQIVQAERTIQTIAQRLQASDVRNHVVPLKAKVLSTVGKVEPMAARLFGLELQANKSCTQCGLCVRQCPTHNIKNTSKETLRFGFSCMMCMRCMYACPQKAIAPRFSRFIPFKKGYSLAELLDHRKDFDNAKKMGEQYGNIT